FHVTGVQTCALPISFFERHRTGDLKRHFRRVNIVVRTIKQGDLHVHHWEACEHTILELLWDTLIDSRDVFLRNHTAHALVNELRSEEHTSELQSRDT